MRLKKVKKFSFRKTYKKYSRRGKSFKAKACFLLIGLKIKMVGHLSLSQAKMWQKIDNLQIAGIALRRKYVRILFAVLFILAFTTSLLLVNTLQHLLEAHFTTQESLSDYRSLLLTLGGALMGSAAIAFSIVMFAIQVNLERMPYGLFHKVSSDWRLLGTFAFTFILAFFVCCLSLFQSSGALGWVTFSASWSTTLIFVMSLSAYRRALLLVSPLQQLSILGTEILGGLKRWEKRAKVWGQILEHSPKSQAENLYLGEYEFDVTRAAFFQRYPNWLNEAIRAIHYCVSYSRKFSEQGDHEVASKADLVLLAINNAYVQVKGRTFFGHNMLYANLATDGFINENLEQLRKTMRISISRRDEEQMEQTLKTISNLCLVYLQIDYAKENPMYKHAHLAAGYLSEALQSPELQETPDVLMEGLRLLGGTGKSFIAKNDVFSAESIISRIGGICCGAITGKHYLPVIQIGVDQLTEITISLLVSKSSDIQSAGQLVKKQVREMALTMFAARAPDLFDANHQSVTRYFSGAVPNSLQERISKLAEFIFKPEVSASDCERIINHFKQWSEDLFNVEREILNDAIKRRTMATFDLIQWLSFCSKVLLFISKHPACIASTRQKFQARGVNCLQILIAGPSDEKSLSFAETNGISKNLFEIEIFALSEGLLNIPDQIEDILFLWTFTLGSSNLSNSGFYQGLLNLAALSLHRSAKPTELIQKINLRLKTGEPLSVEGLSHTISQIRHKSKQGHFHSSSYLIADRFFESADLSLVKAILTQLADCLESHISTLNKSPSI